MGWGTALEIFNANQVKFELSASGGALSEIVLMHSFRMSKDVNLDRIVTRAGPVDTPTYDLREFTVSASMTKELYERLEALCEQSTRGGVNEADFKLSAKNVSNQTSDDVSVTFKGYVRHLDADAPSEGKFIVNFNVRAKPGSVTIT